MNVYQQDAENIGHAFHGGLGALGVAAGVAFFQAGMERRAEARQAQAEDYAGALQTTRGTVAILQDTMAGLRRELHDSERVAKSRRRQLDAANATIAALRAKVAKLQAESDEMLEIAEALHGKLKAVGAA